MSHGHCIAYHKHPRPCGGCPFAAHCEYGGKTLDNYPAMSPSEYRDNIAGIDYDEIEERAFAALDRRIQKEKEENLDKGL